MNGSRPALVRRGAVALAAVLGLALGAGAGLRAAEDADEPATALTAEAFHKALDAARESTQKGNFSDAFDAYRAALLAPGLAADVDRQRLERAFADIFNALGRLDRMATEAEALLEAVDAAHPEHPRLQWALAYAYANRLPHQGVIVAGEYLRGVGWRQGGRRVSSLARDRVLALRHYLTAMKGLEKAPDMAGGFYLDFAAFLSRDGDAAQSWRLTALTDATAAALPDYDEDFHRDSTAGAPVDADGKALVHALPASWDAAATDGERWRWLLAQAEAASPGARQNARKARADFYYQQFGVQTMAQFGLGRGRNNDPESEPATGPFAVRTLKDEETIARLATGVKRFTLPEDARFIDLYREAAEAGQPRGAHRLGEIYMNRQQYPAAVAALDAYLKKKPDDRRARNMRDDIVRPAGAFDAVATLPAGRRPTLNLLFRNAPETRLTLQRLDEKTMLADIRAYLKNPPENLDWNEFQPSGIGWRVVNRDQEKYIVETVAEWTAKLDPAADHSSRRAGLEIPAEKGGAYLLTALFANPADPEAKPEVARLVFWLADLAIVSKPVAGGQYYYVADAVSGAPVENAALSFFGFRTYARDNRQRVATREFARKSDADGGVVAEASATRDKDETYQWLVEAVGPDGRLAWLGYEHLWNANYNRGGVYGQTKAFIVTDRPVYRPDQTVEGKVWLGHNRYDKDGPSPFAGLSAKLEINDPQGKTLLDSTLTFDAFGGALFQLPLPAGAALGSYAVIVSTDATLLKKGAAPAKKASYTSNVGHAGFRVEEYKKPEFVVEVGTPDKPLVLGESVRVPVTAKYNFGGPVTEARVKYTVTRTEHRDAWQPAWDFDWFYGPGYWWFGYDYPWWPGWRVWGCRRPDFMHAGNFNRPRWGASPPETVAQGEAALDADGRFELEIDSAPAKALHGDLDHKYSIQVEVVDASRRAVFGHGSALATRRPFTVHAWTERGFWRSEPTARAGDPMRVRFKVRSADGSGLKAKGLATLYRVRFDARGAPVENAVGEWPLETDENGAVDLKLEAAAPGQYRAAFSCKDAEGREGAGATVFTVRGPDTDTSDWRFDALELVADRRDYRPGDTVRLAVNADRAGATVMYFLRPENGVAAGRPERLSLKGKSAELAIEVGEGDMPNFFVEAFTVADGRVHTQMRPIAVPPAKRFLNVTLTPGRERYGPGGEADFVVTVADEDGRPYRGQCVFSLYDAAIDQLAGGGDERDIRAFFWKAQRQHHVWGANSLTRRSTAPLKQNERRMIPLGVFGGLEADWEEERFDNDADARGGLGQVALGRRLSRVRGVPGAAGYDMEMAAGVAMAPMAAAAPMTPDRAEASVRGYAGRGIAAKMDMDAGGGGGEAPPIDVRENFADTAYWNGLIETDAQGRAEIKCALPENLTTWQARLWTLAPGNRVGQGSATILAGKDFLLRPQAPRFFTQGDLSTLSAVIHNRHPEARDTEVTLELEGGALETTDDTNPPRRVNVPAGGEVRVDWTVRAARPGSAVVRMRAAANDDGDAVKLDFPVLVHGAPRLLSFSEVIADNAGAAEGIEGVDGAKKLGEAVFTIDVPRERLPDQSRLIVQFSPSVALAAVEALPYLFEQPHETADVELNRFVPAVTARKLLADLGLDLEAIHQNRVNLNAAELGDPATRAAQWGERERFFRRRWAEERGRVDAVFDSKKMRSVIDAGLAKLARQQRSDGGWNWLAGYGGEASAHITASVVHGLQQARDGGVALVPGLLENGYAWLAGYQEKQIRRLREYEKTKAAFDAWNALPQDQRPATPSAVTGKPLPNALDAFAMLVLARDNPPEAYMAGRLFDARLKLPVYCQVFLGLVFHAHNDAERLAVVLENLDQYFVRDDENQTGRLRLAGNRWWYWYDTPLEANAWYLKLLSRVEPKGEKARLLAKYLVNNRRHRSAWDSPRLTAYAVEALLDFARASGEAAARQTVVVSLDGREVLRREITPDNVFVADNRFALDGLAVEEGQHRVAVSRQGQGPLYTNAYLEYFSLEDPIAAAGLDLKVERRVHKLVPKDEQIDVATSTGQAARQTQKRYDRVLLPDPFAAAGAAPSVESGDWLEIELVVEAKNDYEYLVLEDPKAAGLEVLDPRSGYTGGGLGAYAEYRDAKTVFYLTRLAAGRHSLSYRLRAEVPGTYSALPTQASALYAPELRGNANEMKVAVTDKPE